MQKKNLYPNKKDFDQIGYMLMCCMVFQNNNDLCFKSTVES